MSKILQNNFAFTPRHFIFACKVSRNINIFCVFWKILKNVSCIDYSHIGASKIVFFISTQIFPQNIVLNIKCLDVHAIFFLEIFILKYALRQWVHIHLGCQLEIR
jgi:hypothetical protein